MDRKGHLPNPREAEKAFLARIKSKGEITLEDALTFEDFDTYWFGPGVDVLDILDKYIELGVITADPHDDLYRIADNRK